MMGYLSQIYLRAPFSPIIRLTDGVALSRATPGLSNCFALSHMLSLLLRFACRHDRHATTTSAFRPTQRRQKPSFFDKDIAFCLCQRARLKAFNSRHQACNCILPDIFCFFFAFRSLLVLKNPFLRSGSEPSQLVCFATQLSRIFFSSPVYVPAPFWLVRRGR